MIELKTKLLSVFNPDTGTYEHIDTLKGDKGDPGKTPVKGTDYYTEADKAEMISAVIAALPDASEVSY